MKKYAPIFLALILGLMSFTHAEAGCLVVANDSFASAVPLVMSDGTAALTTNNICATKEAGEPDHAENSGGKSVWFKFTPTATKVIRVNTTDNVFDTLLAVYTGSSVNALQLVGYNDNGREDPAFGGASTVDLMMTAGTTYYIAVDGLRSGAITEEGNFKIALLEYDAPDNDNFSSSYNLGYSFRGALAGTNFNASIEANEPTAYTGANPNGKSVWYRWTANDTLSIAFEVTENFDSQIGIYKSDVGGPTVAQLTKITSNIDYTGYTPSRYKTVFFAEKDRTYYIKIDWHTFNDSLSPVGNFQLKYYPNRLKHNASFDYFGQKASIGVFRPTEGVWYGIPYLNQPNPMIRYWGKDGDTPIAVDYNGDGITRLAAVRNENGQKIWYIGSGAGSLFVAIPWGLATDKPVVGDFDRDGRADLTAIRNSASGFLWYVRQSRNNSLRVFNWGTTGDKPVLGDFDGDGYTDVVVIRNAQNGLMWYQIRSGFEVAPLYTQTAAFQFGVAADVPAAADFDGDGKTDVAVFRPSNGTWYIQRSGSGELQITPFGASGDKPQPADYDGDGKADLALFRPSDGNWYLWLSGTNSQQVVHWGTSGDIPISTWGNLSQ